MRLSVFIVKQFARAVMTRRCWVLCLAVVCCGCRATSSTKPELDTRLARHSKDAHVAFADGNVVEAIEQFRRALSRAWAMDDPKESGTLAYNLAAALVSRGENAKARDWLTDARHNYKRAGLSLGNTWLLEARIATEEMRLDDAQRYLRYAQCASPPCESTTSEQCACGDSSCGDPCRENCIIRLPGVGKRVKARRERQQCEDDFQSQIHLARARVAAESLDIDRARTEFDSACQLAADVCSPDLQAEIEDVAALIHLAKDQPLHAARHFDREADLLREAGNYREIPGVLELAAAAYEQAGRFGDGADRLLRVARIWFGRGDAITAWRHAQEAIRLNELACDDERSIRLAIFVHELRESLGDSQPLPAAPLADGNMLNSPR